MLIPLTAACIFNAAAAYYTPVESLYAILRVEGGQVGMAHPNTNGSQDLGPFQINTTWLKTFTIYWRQPNQQATYIRLRDDGCANAYAAAAILRFHLQQTGNLEAAVARYHTGSAVSSAEALRYLNQYSRAMASMRRN